MVELKERPDAISRLESEVQEIRRQIGKMGQALARLGRQRIEGLETDLSDMTDTLTDEGREALHQINRRLSRMERRVERSVHEHPREWMAGAIGVAGIAVILGLALRHRD